VDVLLIDDIQFFTGKEGTQEQFFHTFNALHQSGKQIVLTSDRPPKEIRGLEERLLSRFQWGLVADLQAPDLENRTAILYKKLESEGLKLDNTVVTFIADRISTNVRELEGALNRLLAYASLKKEPVSLDLARRLLTESATGARKHLTIEEIRRKSAEHFGVDLSMMTAKKKTADVALARQVAMYLARSLTDSSLKAIGDKFGGRDHTTVIHACDKVASRMAQDAGFRDRIDSISAALLY
jgi:chromosomal replication initiator protein